MSRSFAKAADDELIKSQAGVSKSDQADHECEYIEKSLIAAAEADAANFTQTEPQREDRARLRQLVRQRREERSKGNASLKYISKSIQKEVKALQRARRQRKIDAMLEQGRSIKYILGEGGVRKQY